MVFSCSSADVNPIGGISKVDLKRFIAWAQVKFDLPILYKYVLTLYVPSNIDLTSLSFLHAVPTAELIPIGPDNIIQSDEIEMGMTYDELSVYGRLRKVEKCGPFSMFGKLVQEWGSFLSPKEIAEKVKHFFFMYAINRHKMYVSLSCWYEVYLTHHIGRPSLLQCTWYVFLLELMG